MERHTNFTLINLNIFIQWCRCHTKSLLLFLIRKFPFVRKGKHKGKKTKKNLFLLVDLSSSSSRSIFLLGRNQRFITKDKSVYQMPIVSCSRFVSCFIIFRVYQNRLNSIYYKIFIKNKNIKKIMNNNNNDKNYDWLSDSRTKIRLTEFFLPLQ